MVHDRCSCSGSCQEGTNLDTGSGSAPVRGCLEAVLGRPGRAARQAVQVPKGLQVQVKASLVALRGLGWLGSAAKGALRRSSVSWGQARKLPGVRALARVLGSAVMASVLHTRTEPFARLFWSCWGSDGSSLLGMLMQLVHQHDQGSAPLQAVLVLIWSIAGTRSSSNSNHDLTQANQPWMTG